MKKMTSAIDNSAVVAVFVTQRCARMPGLPSFACLPVVQQLLLRCLAAKEADSLGARVFAALPAADIDKVASSNSNDNCYIEFTYAHRRQARRLLPVPVEPRCLDPMKWKDHVGARSSSSSSISKHAGLYRPRPRPRARRDALAAPGRHRHRSPVTAASRHEHRQLPCAHGAYPALGHACVRASAC